MKHRSAIWLAAGTMAALALALFLFSRKVSPPSSALSLQPGTSSPNEERIAGGVDSQLPPTDSEPREPLPELESRGIRGRVLLPEGAPPVEASLQVHGASVTDLANPLIQAPGWFEYHWDGNPPVVEIAVQARGYLRCRRFARFGDAEADLRLVPETDGGRLRWTLESTVDDPVPNRVRVCIYQAEDPRKEWKGCSVESFFLGLQRRITHINEPILDVDLDGMPGLAGECRFELRCVPPGSMLVHILRPSGRAGAACVQVHAEECTDLGVISLEEQIRELRIVDRSNLRPVEGARVLPLFEGWAISRGVLSNAAGEVRLNVLGAQGVRVEKEGYWSARRNLREQGQTIELRAMEPLRVSVRPGAWIFSQGGGGDHATVGKSDGTAYIPRSARSMIECDPVDWKYWVRPVLDGELLTGACSLQFSVKCGESELSWGSIMLHAEGSAAVFGAGLRDGIADFEGLPEGHYVGELRIGPQVHDNDHEYVLSRLRLSTSFTERTLVLPDGVLNLRLVKTDSTPLAHEPVRILGQGNDPVSGLDYRISSSGRTSRDGYIGFEVLPRTSFAVHARGEIFEVSVHEDGRCEELLIP